MTTAYTCARCSGTGHYSFNLIKGTVCFGCNGTGKQKTKPRAPTPKWAVFGQHRATSAWIRLYNVTAKTSELAVTKAREMYQRGSADWRGTYMLDEARALKWTDMTDVQALSWDEAVAA